MPTDSQIPRVLVLGGNFAGLGAAQKIRDYAGDAVDITVIDRKAYLDYNPNIPLEIFEGRDPAKTMHMPLLDALDNDDIHFQHAEVLGVDVDAKTFTIRPNERPGDPVYDLPYDKLVIALRARLAYDEIEGFDEFGHTVSDAWHANKLIDYLENDYKGGPIAVGSPRFLQRTRGRPDWLPTALAACEGPPVEIALSLAHWLGEHGKGGPGNITLFTPAELIAEDAGEKVVGQLSAEKADEPWQPEVVCIGDMGGGRAFCIHATAWFGGDIQELHMGRLPYAEKLAPKELFFRNKGRVPGWGLPIAKWSAEKIAV